MNISDFIKTLIGYTNIDVLDFWVEPDKHHPEQDVFIARVELMKEDQFRCPKCRQICKKYDRLNDVKRHRSLDLGKNRFYIEISNPRCICPRHGVLKCWIPWAFCDSDYTQAFELRVAYEAAKMPTNLVSKLYRIKWGTVGSCVRRVQNALDFPEMQHRNFKRIAIDETSYQKGHKYITVVQNLDTNEIIWAHDGHGDEVLSIFFESLSEEQRAGIEFVSADGARWITRQTQKYCPNAVRCIDPFHVVAWATESLDNIRKRLSDDTKKKICPAKKPREPHA
jgi:transposase